MQGDATCEGNAAIWKFSMLDRVNECSNCSPLFCYINWASAILDMKACEVVWCITIDAQHSQYLNETEVYDFQLVVHSTQNLPKTVDAGVRSSLTYSTKISSEAVVMQVPKKYKGETMSVTGKAMQGATPADSSFY